MSKRELINAIIEHNQTAAPEFLARFEEPDLQAYLDRVAIVMPRRRNLGRTDDRLQNQSELLLV